MEKESELESPRKKVKLNEDQNKSIHKIEKKPPPKKFNFKASPINQTGKNQKPPYDKLKNAKCVLQEKPADWNQFKKERKELRDKRRKNRSLIDVITEAKKIGEKIRVKNLDAAERTKLINQLHILLGNQNNYVKFVLSHDMARIVQYMLKYGSADIQAQISNEIIPATVLMLQSKYGKFVVKRMLKYANNTIRSKCIQSCLGHAVKLSSHAVSAPVFEYAYSEFASPTEKRGFIQEFFGDMYKQTKDMNVKHLRDVYKNSKDLKAAALGATKANLERILNKELLDSSLVQTVIAQFLSECSVADRTEMISQLAPYMVVLSNSKDGAKAAMTCFWHGINKDRKTAIKAVKEHILDMCKHEHAHTAIICLLDSADDTILVKKAILSEIINDPGQLIADDWGRKVLAWIASPGDRTQFHPQFIKELEDGRAASSCKKDAEVRRKEIADCCIKTLLEKIAEDAEAWCANPKRMLVTALILKADTAWEIAGPAFASLAQLVVGLKIEEELFIENSGINMSLKKLIQNDVNIKGESTFGNAIIGCLNDDILKTWIPLNRGCFLLADIYSNNKPETQKQLRELLQPHMPAIKSQKTKGAEIMLKKLA